jgi:NADP-dependent 3-hydroxy acid dehydrogenase YdfG
VERALRDRFRIRFVESHMAVKLKSLKDQTIVITGASSGIGRCTALLAARRGANVVAVARNETALREVVDEIHALGGRAMWHMADVAEPDQLDAVAQAAVDRFGGFDTWVNDAGVGLYGRLDEIPLAEKRRLFDVVFWGIVNGCRSALPHLRERGGGAIINLGSVESDVALPLTGIYAAAKHAVKAYTDTLRV